MAQVKKSSAQICTRTRLGPWLDVDGSLQLLNSGHVREGDKALLWGILVGGRISTCRTGSVVVLMVMVVSFGSVLFHLWLRSVNILSFTVSWRWMSLIGLGVFCGMGGCLCSLALMSGEPS